nr:hypothetical protein [Tanacetum cinerariifolium]
MDMTIDQQVALDEALESTLQLAYDVLRLTPFYKVFLVTADVPEIYMQEFWATAMVHHYSIQFKMDNKKHIVNLEYFREMLHIYPRLPGHTFDELPFKEEILAFLRFLGHSEEIRRLTDVNINKLHQPWRSFAAIINKFLRGKSTGYNSLRNSEAYKEYYVVATGAAPPKTKASVRKTKSSSDTIVTPPTAAVGTRLSTFAKGKQPAKASKAKSLTVLSKVAMTEAEQLKLATKRILQQTHISQASGSSADEGTDDDDDVDEGSDDQDDVDAQDDDDDDQVDENKDDDDQDEGDDNDDQEEEETKDEESFDPIAKTSKNSDDEGNDEENIRLNVGREEGQDEEDDEDKLYRDTTSQMDVQAPTTVAPLTFSAPTLTPSTIATISTVPQAPTPPTTAPSTLLQNLPNFGSLFRFDHRFKTLEANFSEYMQTNQFAGAVSSIPEIVQRYMDQRMNEAVKVKVQVSKILPKIEKTLNEQLEAEVLTRSSNSSKTSYAVTADLSEMELKKILIEKIEGNKSIHQFDVQRNLYKALVEAYESDKIILDTCRDVVTLKRHRDDDADKDKEPSAGSDQGSKRRREGKELESTSALKEKATNLQLGVESYQKKLNLTRPDTYRSDLKRKEAYTSYSNPREFIYQNKDKQNSLMQIDELHKFSDGTLIDVRTALDDRLKGIRIKYLPQTIWRKSDKERAAAMIQAIDKQLKTRRIMRSLERYTVVRHRYSNPMIQPELEGSTQGYPLVSVEVIRYDKRSKSENIGIVPTDIELILEHTQRGISHEVSVSAEEVEE